MDKEQDQPDSDDQAFLDKERAVSEFQNPGHGRVALAAAPLNPKHREECIENVQQKDGDDECDIDRSETVDVGVRILTGTASTFSVSMAEERGPRGGRLLASVDPLASVYGRAGSTRL